MYRPATREEKALGDRPPETFLKALQERGVDPLAVRRVIVATWHPHETTVFELNGARGAGVTELIDHIITSDLSELEPQIERQ